MAKGKAKAQKRKPEEEADEPQDQPKAKAEPAKKRGKAEEQEKAEQNKAEEPKELVESEDKDDDDDEDEGGSEGDDSEDEGDSAYEQFMEQIKLREQELSKHCVVLGTLDEDDEDDDEDEEADDSAVAEKLQGLARVYVPQQYETYWEGLMEKLSKIGASPDESDDEELPPELAALGIRMLSTKHSYPMQEILKEQLKQVDKAIKKKDWPDAFAQWAATLMAGRRENHWYGDTDQPKVAEGIYDSLRKHWLKLKEHSDEELGGLVAEACDSAKNEFEAFLQGMADEMKEVGIKATDVVKKSKK